MIQTLYILSMSCSIFETVQIGVFDSIDKVSETINSIREGNEPSESQAEFEIHRVVLNKLLYPKDLLNAIDKIPKVNEKRYS